MVFPFIHYFLITFRTFQRLILDRFLNEMHSFIPFYLFTIYNSIKGDYYLLKKHVWKNS